MYELDLSNDNLKKLLKQSRIVVRKVDQMTTRIVIGDTFRLNVLEDMKRYGGERYEAIFLFKEEGNDEFTCVNLDYSTTISLKSLIDNMDKPDLNKIANNFIKGL